MLIYTTCSGSLWFGSCDENRCVHKFGALVQVFKCQQSHFK